jgi:putative aldouronate transport system substrate-binding protein
MTGMNDPNAMWIAAPIVGANGQTAHPQIALRLGGYLVINSECEHPEAVIKLLNFWVESQGNSTREVYESYMYQGSDGLMYTPQHWTMLKCYSPTQTLEDYYSVCEAIEKNDESVLSPSAATYYPDVKGFLDGDPTKAGPYAMIGPENSAFSVMAKYHENDLFVFDAFTGSPTKTMGSKESLVNDKIYEYYTKVIMGSASLNDWDAFIKEINDLGLADITTEVNEWYASK